MASTCSIRLCAPAIDVAAEHQRAMADAFSHAGNSQITYLQLIAKKIAVAQSTSSDVSKSGLDSLNEDGDSV